MITCLCVRNLLLFINLCRFLQNNNSLILAPFLTRRLGPAHCSRSPARFASFAAFCSFACCLTLPICAQSQTVQPHTAPHWICHPSNGNCDLERAFQLDQRVHTASMRFAADFCDAKVEISGQAVLSVEPY